MPGFTKLFSDIVDSSIWKEPPSICKVWITLLSQSDADGFVRGSVGWLADKAKVSSDECQEAVSKFAAPDPFSRTPDNEGRRIELLPDGFLILNYLAFRDRLTNDEKMQESRERVRQHKENYKKKARPDGYRQPSASRYDGYVYYFLEPAAHRVKIGYSSNPWARLSELRGGNPTLSIEATERGTIDTERERHKRFEQYRLDGEWFTFSKEIQDFVVLLRSSPTPSVVTTGAVSASASASVLDLGDKSQREEPPKSFKQWTREDFVSECARANQPPLLTPAEVEDFVSYWCEPSASGRFRFSMEKTWDTRRRMNTALRVVFERQRINSNRGAAGTPLLKSRHT